MRRSTQEGHEEVLIFSADEIAERHPQLPNQMRSPNVIPNCPIPHTDEKRDLDGSP